ncbi:MAG: low molecular weight phosphatase family protein [Thermoplasmata archaeon]
MVRGLFVSPYDAARGPMAEAFALAYADDSMDFFSAGLVPAGFVRPQATAVLEEAGLQVDWEHPRYLLAEHLIDVDYLITIDAEVDEDRMKHFRGIHCRWKVENVLNKGLDVAHYRRVRDEIDALARDLVFGLRSGDLEARIKASGGKAEIAHTAAE